jgi:hypothetical protein
MLYLIHHHQNVMMLQGLEELNENYNAETAKNTTMQFISDWYSTKSLALRPI